MKAMDMKSRIELELRGKDASTIKELNLDSCRAQSLDGLTDNFKSLEILSLINVGLTNLKGFPKLPNLRKLELSDNRISSGLDNLIGCVSLTHLNLSGNKFKDLDSLAPLAQLLTLRNLDLFNCDVTQIEQYREKVFKLLPNLKYLDGFDQNEQEEDEFEGENESDDDDDDDEEGEDEEEGKNFEEDDDDDDEDEEGDEDDDEEGEEDEEEIIMTKKVVLNGKKGVNGSNKNKNKINGSNDDDEEEVDDDDDDDDEEEDDENEVGLSYLQKSNLEEDEDDEDFDEEKAMRNAGEEEDDDEEDEDEENDENISQANLENVDDNSTQTRSRKRKLEETGDDDSKTQ